MNQDRPFRICWTRQQATAIFVTEALEGDDAIFLATHTPIKGFDVDGRDKAEFAALDERAVLETLSEPERKHAFCVVQGEPGSGKSHLIRWLWLNWPDGRDVTLLLRRADGSLEGALGQLRDRLPSEFHPLFESLGTRQRASSQGRANNFLSTLANTLDPGHYDQRIGDEEWCERHRPGEILGLSHVRARWQGPARILQVLEGKGGERNSQSAAFDVFDVAELAEIARPVSDQLRGSARDLARRLEREAELIRDHRAENWLASDLATERATDLPYSLKLAEVLNKRRNDAVQNVLGVSAQGLKTLFRTVRQKLQERGQRLVLLLEDITSWEGIDDSLIDVLVFNAAASGGEDARDVCPLISVVGLTPTYHQQLQGNYRQRITHEIVLGRSTGGLQDVAALRDPAERLAFVIRYLAAVRAGVPALHAWRADLANAPALPPPNICNACPKQESCHALFGAGDGIGLFPFNARALERFFDALKVDDNGQTWRTPRGLLQAVLNPCLSQPEAVDAGWFPGPLIESSAIERTRLPENAVSGRLDAILAARIPDAEERARFRRAAAFWGDPESADTRVLEGEPAFAGMRRSLHEALDLPWLGEATSAAEGRTESSEVRVGIPSPASPRDLAPTSLSTGLQGTSAEGGEAGRTAEAGAVRAVIRRQEVRETRIVAPARHRRTPSQREAMREEIRQWAAGGALGNSSRWNDLAYEMVAALDPRSIGVSPYVFKKVVTREMVKLEGSTAALRSYLVLPHDDWMRAGLEAVLELELKSGMSDGDRAFHRRNIAIMMRRLEVLAANYVRRRLPLDESDSIWSPTAAIAQVLQARAWLRGTLLPDAPVVEQMRNILSDEDAAVSDPASRSAPWMDWLTATRSWHERLRDDLRGMISLGIDGGAAGALLTDASEIAGALARMREGGRMDAVPTESGALPDTMSKARELAILWNDKRAHIVATEFGQIKGRALTLAGLLRHRTIEAHLARLDGVIGRTSALLPHASADLVAAWAKERARVTPRVAEALTRIEDLILAFDDEASIPGRLPTRLAWLSVSPARALDEVLTLAQAGEKAAVSLGQHAADCVREGQQAGSLEAIKAIGRALRRAAETGSAEKDAA